MLGRALRLAFVTNLPVLFGCYTRAFGQKMHGCSKRSDFAVSASRAVQFSEHVQPIRPARADAIRSRRTILQNRMALYLNMMLRFIWGV